MENDVMPIDKDIQVVENFTFDYRYLSFLILKNKEQKEGEIKKKKAAKLFLKAMRSFPINLLLGEGAFLYIWNSYRKARKLIKENQKTVLYSSFPPYADHIVAYLLKKKYPDIYWVADFRDLHVDPIFKNYLFKSVQIWVNKKIIPQADLVTTVSEGLAIKLKQFCDDIYVLPNGVRELSSEKKNAIDYFTFSYTGSMFRDKWKPHIIFEAIDNLVAQGKIQRNKIKFQQAGRDTNMWIPVIDEYCANDIFVSNRVVPHDKAISMQRNSHINVLLTVSSENHKGILTSKIYEYLAAGNPVIIIINGPKDEVFEKAMEGIQPLLIAYHESSTIEVEKFILDLYLKWDRCEEYPSIDPLTWSSRYFWPDFVKPFFRKIAASMG